MRFLEIIHMEICGSFPIKTIYGFGPFTTFTNNLSWYEYGYAYPIKE